MADRQMSWVGVIMTLLVGCFMIGAIVFFGAECDERDEVINDLRKTRGKSCIARGGTWTVTRNGSGSVTHTVCVTKEN